MSGTEPEKMERPVIEASDRPSVSRGVVMPAVGHRVSTSKRDDGKGTPDEGVVVRIEDGGYCTVRWDSDDEKTSVRMMSLKRVEQTESAEKPTVFENIRCVSVSGARDFVRSVSVYLDNGEVRIFAPRIEVCSKGIHVHIFEHVGHELQVKKVDA